MGLVCVVPGWLPNWVIWDGRSRGRSKWIRGVVHGIASQTVPTHANSPCIRGIMGELRTSQKYPIPALAMEHCLSCVTFPWRPARQPSQFQMLNIFSVNSICHLAADLFESSMFAEPGTSQLSHPTRRAFLPATSVHAKDLLFGKNAASEDRTHDPRIMRPTRHQLPYRRLEHVEWMQREQHLDLLRKWAASRSPTGALNFHLVPSACENVLRGRTGMLMSRCKSKTIFLIRRQRPVCPLQWRSCSSFLSSVG